MRFTFLFFAVLAFLAVFAAANDDHTKCYKKNGNIIGAINKLCGWTYDMTVPSSKAWFGASQGGATARIQGNCKPKQWVPREWCLKNFWNVCASSVRRGGNGSGRKSFGRNGCQQFIIGLE